MGQGRKIELAGVTIDMSFCEAYDKWSSILAVYSKVNFPINGGMGMTIGTLQNTNLIVDLCSYMTQMASLDTQGQIFATAQALNKLTNDQHTEEIDFMANLWDLKSMVVDKNGKFNAKALEMPSFHRRLVNTTMQGASLAGYDIPTRIEKQREMSNMARIAYQRSAIKGYLQCPKPDNVDYLAKYEKEIAPIENANQVLKFYIDSYEVALIEMGKKFLVTDEYKTYLEELNSVIHRTSLYNPQIVNRSVESEEMVAKPKKEGDKASQPKTEPKKTSVIKTYQVFNEPRVNVKYKNDFISKYSPKWNFYVKLERASQTRGILNSDRESRIADAFKDPDVICNRGKSAQKFDVQDPQYLDKVKKDQEECFKNSDQVIEKSGGLFTFYVESLVQKDRQFKVNQGRIWGFESIHLGNVINVSEGINTDAIGSYAQPEVQCAPINNMGVLAKLQLEQEALNGELTQEIIAQQMKQNTILENEKNEKRRREEEDKRKAEIIREMELRKTYINDDLLRPNIENINF